MANLLYENYGNLPNPISELIRQAKDFKRSFNGSPKDEVQRLLNSGEMSQQEFNRLSQIARQVVQAMDKNI
jgi:hypothetical protein